MIHIQGYKNIDHLILGQIECFGLYEVYSDLLSSDHEIPETNMEFFNDIFIVTETRNIPDLNEIGIFQEDYLFYDLTPSYSSGRGFRTIEDKNIEVMFSPNFIKPSILKFGDKYNELLSELNATAKELSIKNNEENKLTEFISILDKIIAEKGILRMIIA